MIWVHASAGMIFLGRLPCSHGHTTSNSQTSLFRTSWASLHIITQALHLTLAPERLSNFKMIFPDRNWTYSDTKIRFKSLWIRCLNTSENLVLWLSSHQNAFVSCSQRTSLILPSIDRNPQLQLGMCFLYSLLQATEGPEPLSLQKSSPVFTKTKG